MRLAMEPSRLGSAFDGLERQELRALAVARLNRGGRFRAEVLLVQKGEDRAVLKDFAEKPVAFAQRYGRWMIEREVRAFECLSNHDRVPRLIRRVGPMTILIEWHDARPLLSPAGSHPGPSFFEVLSTAVDSMHREGLVHLDLRQRRNILVDRESRPLIVDFASSIFVSRLSPLRLVFPLLRAVDRAAVLKHKRRFSPEGLSDRERWIDRGASLASRIWDALVFRSR